VLQNVQPNAGFQPLAPATYRFRILTGQGKTAQSGKQMVSVQMEVINEGKAKGRKVWHNWVLPDQHDDKAEQSLGFFLGDMLAFGITKEWLIQSFGNQAITREHCEFIAQQLVNRACKANATLQKNDATRNNFGSFTEDDGVDPPEPAAAPTAGSLGLGTPPPPAMPGVQAPPAGGGFPPPAPGGMPAPGMPQPGMAPPAQAAAMAPPAPQQYAAPPAQEQQAPPMAPPQAPPVQQAPPQMPGMPGAPAAAPPAFQPPSQPGVPAPQPPGVPQAGAPAAPQASF